MANLPIYNGQIIGFKGQSIERSEVKSDVRITEKAQLPLIDTNNPPPGHYPAVGGGLAYDTFTQQPYYSDGFQWLPFNASSSGTVASYSFIKTTEQNVPTRTDTVIQNWATPSSVYHTIPGWDLVNGVYTASKLEILTLKLNISWKSGITNLGDRYLMIQYLQFGGGTWETIKEVITQADPNQDVETTQECAIHARIDIGDAVRVVVMQDSPVDIPLTGNNHTSISGFRVNV